MLCGSCVVVFFFFSSRRRHTRSTRDWSSDVCSSDLISWRALRGKAATDPGGEIAPRRGRLQKAHRRGGPGQRPDIRWLRLRRVSHRSEERRVGKEGECQWSWERGKKERKKHNRETCI